MLCFFLNFRIYQGYFGKWKSITFSFISFGVCDVKERGVGDLISEPVWTVQGFERQICRFRYLFQDIVLEGSLIFVLRFVTNFDIKMRSEYLTIMTLYVEGLTGRILLGQGFDFPNAEESLLSSPRFHLMQPVWLAKGWCKSHYIFVASNII